MRLTSSYICSSNLVTFMKNNGRKMATIVYVQLILIDT